MFIAEERDRLRADLLELASRDSRISGAAITGSAAGKTEDKWSDIDLAFGVDRAEELEHVISDWTAHMYDRQAALHHVDVFSGAWLYRVFLLPSTLQVDLAFVPASDFRALGPTFTVVSGIALEPRFASPPNATNLIGFGWLYALHARTCIARGRLWQAEYMISATRDTALALACLRHGQPTSHGRGMDLLPRSVAAQFHTSLVRELELTELKRAFAAVLCGLVAEVHSIDPRLACRLEAALQSLTEGCGS